MPRKQKPKTDFVEQHVEEATADGIIVTPGHEERTESAVFRANKEQMHEDGITCWICGGTKNLQVHHLACEWSLQELADLVIINLIFASWEWDVHGYSKKLAGTPIETTEDIRCLMMLCQEHHTGTNSTEDNPTGIHNLVFPFWLMQRVAKKAAIPVPQEGETLEETETEIAKATEDAA